jgi:prepilin-type processing-associated H-X9-DG protein
MQRITKKDVTDWLRGRATESVRAAIFADKESPDSLVNEYLAWMKEGPSRPTPRLVREHFDSMPLEMQAVFDEFSKEDDEAAVTAPSASAVSPRLDADSQASVRPPATLDDQAVPPLGAESSTQAPSPSLSWFRTFALSMLKFMVLFPLGFILRIILAPVFLVLFLVVFLLFKPLFRVLEPMMSRVARLLAASVKGMSRIARLLVARVKGQSSDQPRHRPTPYQGWSFPRIAGEISLIECIMTTSILGVLALIMLPAVQHQASAPRRAQCINNLKQLALAAHNYVNSHGCFPGGSYSGTLFNPPYVGDHPGNFSCFTRLLQYTENLPTYNAINFDLSSSDPANLTISGTQIGILMCPSDERNKSIPLPAMPESRHVTPGWNFNQMYPLPPGTWTQAFTSYGGNAGTFTFGFSNLMPPEVLRHHNGVIYNDSSVTLADITDGTSTTFLFGERSKGHLFSLDPDQAVSDGSWNSGRWRDTLFATLYPLNLAAGNGRGLPKSGRYYPTAAGSYHPGGAIFAFCDGSVRFIKNSKLSSWSFSARNANPYGDPMPDGTVFMTVFPKAPHTKTGAYLKIQIGASAGIYQQLSTRAGGEVISEDQY